MDRTACTEPHCLYKVALYLYLYLLYMTKMFNLYSYIIRDFYLPTDAEENCSINNIKIYIKTAPTCFGLITIIRELIIRACSISTLPDDGD